MHSKISGVSDQLAEDEFDAIVGAREWVASLNWKESYTNVKLRQQLLNNGIGMKREVEFKPVVKMDTLLDVAKADIRKPWDIMELVARIVDGSRFMPFKTVSIEDGVSSRRASETEILRLRFFSHFFSNL